MGREEPREIEGGDQGRQIRPASHEARQAESGSDFAHFGRRDFFGLAERLVGGGNNHIFEQLSISRVERLRVNFDRGDGSIAAGNDLDGAAAASRFDSALGETALDLFHLLLHPRSLFHEFADTGHGLLRS